MKALCFHISVCFSPPWRQLATADGTKFKPIICQRWAKTSPYRETVKGKVRRSRTQHGWGIHQGQEIVNLFWRKSMRKIYLTSICVMWQNPPNFQNMVWFSRGKQGLVQASTWTTLIVGLLGGLCWARGWTPWSLEVHSNSRHSVILWYGTWVFICIIKYICNRAVPRLNSDFTFIFLCYHHLISCSASPVLPHHLDEM